jgi:hypothetical protein
LKKKALPIRDSAMPAQTSSEYVDISINARRKQMLNQISGQLISQIAPRDDQYQRLENTEEIEPQVINSEVRSNHEAE